MTDLPDHLLSGYRTFMKGRYASESGRFRTLAREGQAPETMVIACCDSRSAPEAVFDALTNPRRLVLWEHPVEYFPRLEVGATIFARLNMEVGAVALGKIIEVDPPRAFAFRWTTNNPMLPPEL